MKSDRKINNDKYLIANKLDKIIELLQDIEERIPRPYIEVQSLSEWVLANQPKKGFVPSVKRIFFRIKQWIGRSWQKFQSFLCTRIVITTIRNDYE